MTAAPKRRWFALTVRFCVLGLIGLIALASIILYFGSFPQWILLVDNEANATRIRMITTETDAPIYEVRVLGEQFSSAHLRLLATEARTQKVDGITTLFMDRTLGPGRWVFKIDSVYLDCQPARIIVNGTEHSPPATVTVDNPSRGTPFVPPREY